MDIYINSIKKELQAIIRTKSQAQKSNSSPSENQIDIVILRLAGIQDRLNGPNLIEAIQAAAKLNLKAVLA